MTRHTYLLLTSLIRLAKGGINAFEGWVRVTYEDSKPEADEPAPQEMEKK